MNIFLRDICGGTVSAELWDACGGSTNRKEADGLTEEKRADILEYLKNCPFIKSLQPETGNIFLHIQATMLIMICFVRKPV